MRTVGAIEVKRHGADGLQKYSANVFNLLLCILIPYVCKTSRNFDNHKNCIQSTLLLLKNSGKKIRRALLGVKLKKP